eukprot:3159355-Rhodomonas_salina.2
MASGVPEVVLIEPISILGDVHSYQQTQNWPVFGTNGVIWTLNGLILVLMKRIPGPGDPKMALLAALDAIRVVLERGAEKDLSIAGGGRLKEVRRWSGEGGGGAAAGGGGAGGGGAKGVKDKDSTEMEEQEKEADRAGGGEEGTGWVERKGGEASVCEIARGLVWAVLLNFLLGISRSPTRCPTYLRLSAYAMPGTDIAYQSMFALSGTEIAYFGAASLPPYARDTQCLVLTSISLSAQGLARRRPVLTSRMVLLGASHPDRRSRWEPGMSYAISLCVC